MELGFHTTSSDRLGSICFSERRSAHRSRGNLDALRTPDDCDLSPLEKKANMHTEQGNSPSFACRWQIISACVHHALPAHSHPPLYGACPCKNDNIRWQHLNEACVRGYSCRARTKANVDRAVQTPSGPQCTRYDLCGAHGSCLVKAFCGFDIASSFGPPSPFRSRTVFQVPNTLCRIQHRGAAHGSGPKPACWRPLSRDWQNRLNIIACSLQAPSSGLDGINMGTLLVLASYGWNGKGKDPRHAASFDGTDLVRPCLTG